MSPPNTSPFEFDYLDASSPPADYRNSIRFQCIVVMLIVASTVIVQWTRPMIVEASLSYRALTLESIRNLRVKSREYHRELSEQSDLAYRRTILIGYTSIGIRLFQFLCYLPFLLSVFLLTSKRHLSGRYLAFLAAATPLAISVYHSDLGAVSVFALDGAVFLYQYLIIAFAGFCLSVRQVANWQKPLRVLAFLPPILLLFAILEFYCTSTHLMRILALVATAASLVCLAPYLRLCFRRETPIVGHKFELGSDHFEHHSS